LNVSTSNFNYFYNKLFFLSILNSILGHAPRADDREISDGEYSPACADSCPAEAIFFGDLENKESKVFKLSNSPRAFRELEDLGTIPKVFYLSEKE